MVKLSFNWHNQLSGQNLDSEYAQINFLFKLISEMSNDSIEKI